MFDSTVEVKRFGNGRRTITPGYIHAVKTKEWFNLQTSAGELPANKVYTAHSFVETQDGTFAHLRIGEDEFTSLNIKCLDYIKPLRRKQP